MLILTANRLIVASLTTYRHSRHLPLATITSVEPLDEKRIRIALWPLGYELAQGTHEPLRTVAAPVVLSSAQSAIGGGVGASPKLPARASLRAVAGSPWLERRSAVERRSAAVNATATPGAPPETSWEALQLEGRGAPRATRLWRRLRAATGIVSRGKRRNKYSLELSCDSEQACSTVLEMLGRAMASHRAEVERAGRPRPRQQQALWGVGRQSKVVTSALGK